MRRLFPICAALLFLAACAQNKLSPDEASRLQGGTTTVVVYGFCIPMDHLIKTAMTRSTINFLVDGQKVGTMQSCSHQTFTVKSGYWNAKFEQEGLFGSSTWLHEEVFRPGETQYLYMYPAGYGTFGSKWVSKADADGGIAAISKIGQMF